MIYNCVYDIKKATYVNSVSSHRAYAD